MLGQAHGISPPWRISPQAPPVISSMAGTLELNGHLNKVRPLWSVYKPTNYSLTSRINPQVLSQLGWGALPWMGHLSDRFSATIHTRPRGGAQVVAAHDQNLWVGSFSQNGARSGSNQMILMKEPWNMGIPLYQWTRHIPRIGTSYHV